MPAPCKPFQKRTLLWQRVIDAVAGGALGDDGPSFLEWLVEFEIEEDPLRPDREELKRLRRERAIRDSMAHSGLNTSKATAELFSRLRLYERTEYPSDRKRGSASSDHEHDFIILANNDGRTPSDETIRKILSC